MLISLSASALSARTHLESLKLFGSFKLQVWRNFSLSCLSRGPVISDVKNLCCDFEMSLTIVNGWRGKLGDFPVCLCGNLSTLEKELILAGAGTINNLQYI